MPVPPLAVRAAGDGVGPALRHIFPPRL